jgi:hypothetical protein
MTATVAGWIAYAAEAGDTVADDAGTAAALVRGQRYITRTYVNYFSASFSSDSDGVDDAIYEAATLELATPGFWSKTFTPDQQRVLTKVDKIQWTVKDGGKAGAAAATPVSTAVDALLRRYMRSYVGAFSV